MADLDQAIQDDFAMARLDQGVASETPSCFAGAAG